MHGFIKQVPIPAAGLALGLVSLGGLLRPISDTFLWIGGSLAALLIVLLIVRICLHADSIREDLKNPVLASVSGTFFMTIMQLASACHAAFPNVALVVWFAAVIGHLALIVWFTVAFASHRTMTDVFPTWFIAYVGIVVATVTAPTFGMQQLGIMLFWFGFACYAALLVIVTYRVVTRKLAGGTRPLLCIYAAPMSLSLTGYLSCFSTPNVTMTIVLALLAQVLLVIVLTRLPGLFKLLHGQFYPSCAAMTFPFVITATGLTKTIAYLASCGIVLPGAVTVLCMVETALAALMVLYAAVRYLGYFASVARECAERSELAAQES